jgi:hypothetical protein
MSLADIFTYISLAFLAISIVFSFVGSYLNSRDSQQKSLQIAELTNKNLELEEAVAPRLIDQGKLSTELSKMSGIQYEIIVVPEFESRRTAGQLNFTFGMANWVAKSFVVANDQQALQFFDGITIEKNVGVVPDTDKAPQAAQLLVDGLNEQNIQAKTFPAVPELPPNTIRIKVGLKPIDFFLNEATGSIKANQAY